MIEALEDKKAEDILLIDLKGVTSFTDYFVLCNGTSARMLDALAKTAQETGKGKLKRKPRIEGQPHDGWMLVDFGDVLVHIFTPDQRKHYDLEELWNEGKVLLKVQ